MIKILKMFTKNKRLNIREYNIFGIDRNVEMSDVERSKVDELISDIDVVVDISYEEVSEIYVDERRRLKLIDDIVGCLVSLHEFGKKNKIYNDDYVKQKNRLVDLLSMLFGNHLTIDSLNDVVAKLERLEIFPPDSKKEFIKMTPLSRWGS